MVDGQNIEIKIPSIQGMDEIVKPSDRPVLGNQRLVRFVRLENFGEFPVIWTSPYTVMSSVVQNGPEVPVRVCLILVSKGPPRPDTVGIYLQDEALFKCKLAPVEW